MEKSSPSINGAIWELIDTLWNVNLVEVTNIEKELGN